MVTLLRTARTVFFGVFLLVAVAACGDEPLIVNADAPSGADGVPGGGASAAPPTTAPVVAPTAVEPTPSVPSMPDEAADSQSPSVAEDDAAGETPQPAVSQPDAEDPEPTPPATPLPDPGTDSTEGSPPSQPGPDGEGTADPSPSQPPPSNTQWERVASAPELLSPTIAEPEAVLLGADGRTVLVRFWNGVEPCSLARVTLFEQADAVVVQLETGANPNAATMTCIALAAAYEIAAPLTSDLNGRPLVVATQGPDVGPTPDPFEGAEFPTDQYLGLTEDEAIQLAGVEQRAIRVTRIDGEEFPVTMDFVPTRVNIELDNGIVTVATSG